MTDIVPISHEHIDSICEIENESFSDPWNREMFLELLENSYTVGFAAVDNTGTAGYLIAYHIIDEIQILNIAVKKSRRNQKIATKLFGVVFGYAQEKNAVNFTLEARASNTGAMAMYKKLGFKIDGVRKNYYANPKEDAILMSLRLKNK